PQDGVVRIGQGARSGVEAVPALRDSAAAAADGIARFEHPDVHASLLQPEGSRDPRRPTAGDDGSANGQRGTRPSTSPARKKTLRGADPMRGLWDTSKSA